MDTVVRFTGIALVLFATTSLPGCPCGCSRCPVDTLQLQFNPTERIAFEIREDWITQDERMHNAGVDFTVDHRISTLTTEINTDGIRWSLALPRIERITRETTDVKTVGLGDALLRARLTTDQFDIIVGIKLPTGASDQTLSAPRRYLQLGTGSTDVLFGIRSEQRWSEQTTSYVQFNAQSAVFSDKNFRPGRTVGLSFGFCQKITGAFACAVQGDVTRQFRDKNTMHRIDSRYAEDEESSTLSASISPGFIWSPQPTMRAFIYLTEPLNTRNYAQAGGETINPMHTSRIVSLGLILQF